MLKALLQLLHFKMEYIVRHIQSNNTTIFNTIIIHCKILVRGAEMLAAATASC